MKKVIKKTRKQNEKIKQKNKTKSGKILKIFTVQVKVEKQQMNQT